MDKIHSFITQAREKGMADDAIRKSLESEGWDKASIDVALLGLEVPKPEGKSPQTSPEAQTHLFTLNPLMAALHHVILWFFIASSSVTIGGTVASLYGVNVSTQVLASMIAVTLITFIPYAILFAIFLGKTRKNPLLVPGKVWSIITICLNSVGAMTAAIVAVVNLITSGDRTFLVSAALIFLLDIIVVLTYSFAAFGIGRALKLRKVIIILHLPILVIMFGVLFGLSFLQFGAARHDEELRTALSGFVGKVRTTTRQNEKLPDSVETPKDQPSITYRKTNTTTYEVCGDFQTANNNYSRPGGPEYYPAYDDMYRENTTSDAYISENSFYQTKTGKNCFNFTSDYLKQKDSPSSSPYLSY